MVTDQTTYTRLMLQTGPFGCQVDMCMTCGAMLPTGVEAAGRTPQQQHTAWHAGLELTAHLVDVIGADLERRADYEQEMRERADG